MSSDSLPNASGVYKITCTTTGKIYIGSAIDLRDRRRCHFKELRQNNHHNRYLQNAWNKYGEQAFTFEVLEYVLPMSLTAREQYWFNRLKPFGRKGYNLAPIAGSPLGIKRSPETIERMRQANLGKELSPEHREKIRQAGIGRKQSLTAIEKMRQAKLGNKNSLGYKHEPAAIEKIRQAHLGKPKSLQHREKLSQAKSGKSGRKHTPETREKMRQAKIGNKSRLGQKLSPETREKIRQAKLGKKRVNGR